MPAVLVSVCFPHTCCSYAFSCLLGGLPFSQPCLLCRWDFLNAVTCGDTTFPMQLEDTVIPNTNTYTLLDKDFQMTSFSFQEKTDL